MTDFVAREIAEGMRDLIAGPLASQDVVMAFVSAELREVRRAARSAALEEAAKVADTEAATDKYATDSQAHRIAAAIRALKDK